jgi:hypothetical protein
LRDCVVISRSVVCGVVVGVVPELVEWRLWSGERKPVSLPRTVCSTAAQLAEAAIAVAVAVTQKHDAGQGRAAGYCLGQLPLVLVVIGRSTPY